MDRWKLDGMLARAAKTLATGETGVSYLPSGVAIHDALKIFGGPVVEVHLSDPKAREPFRHHSYITPLAAAVISGKGAAGYAEALAFFVKTNKSPGSGP